MISRCRTHEPWGDRVDADAILRPFHGKLWRQATDGPLSRPVRRRWSRPIWPVGGHRGGEDNGASGAELDEFLRRDLSAKVWAKNVGVKKCLDLGTIDT